MTQAFVFPGQGSQFVGMGVDLAEVDAAARDVFAEADAALGRSISDVIATGPEAELGRTEVTQPALVTASTAAWRAYRARGGRMPAVMAGHSLGEYSALVAAEALTFTDAVRLVRERGRLMQAAAPEGAGAMAAIIGLDAGDVTRVCDDVSEGDGLRVQPANLNAPGQVVIAGHAAAVDAALEAAKAAGAKRALPLKVSVAAHSALMAPAVEAFATLLADTPIATPVVPVLHNATLGPLVEPDAIRDALALQLTAPVDWVTTVGMLIADYGVTSMVECGPSSVLAGLVKRIDRNIPVRPLMAPAELEALFEEGA